MLPTKLIGSLLVVLLLLASSSCKKEVIADEGAIAGHCEAACDMEPTPDWCPTGAPTKYFFNKTTRTCEGVMTWYEYPFETLAECEACSCTRVIPE